MESMTGYAYMEGNTADFSYSVELKSLNSRYLETNVNLPKVLRNDENDISNMLKDSFSRGKIELNVDIYDWTGTRPVSVNGDVIRKYYDELKKIQKELDVNEPVKLDSVLLLDGITQKERSTVTEKTRREIYDSIRWVIKKATEMRKKEGRSIRKDLSDSLAAIAGCTKSIKALSRNSVAEKRDQLRKRIESIAGEKIDDMRLLTEISILADKLDINEEIVRLNDHLNKFKSYLREDGQVGKKLDFIAQEMFREVNTIASKSGSSEISHTAVDIKNYIDKIREQCRNVV